MKITLEDALSLLSKYAEERTPVLAAFVTPSLSVARVVGTIRVSIVGWRPLIFSSEKMTASPTKSSSDFQIAILSTATFVRPVLKIMVRTSLRDFWS